MHKRERYFAMLNDNRIIRPFEWGAEFVPEYIKGANEKEILERFSEHVVANSDDFFAAPPISDFSLKENILSWTSSVTTPDETNNTAVATYFPHKENRRSAVIVLPHWNAKAGTYFDLCKFFNKVGMSSLRLTMPYHEERMPAELERADHLVSPNIGRTLQSVAQAIADTRSTAAWLKQQGYEKVGIVGTSIGSCVAFMSFVHDENIDAAVFNHVSGFMADVVWNGLSTYHVREGIGDNITLDELRKFWMPVSPMAYMPKLAAQPNRPQQYIYTLYDLSFPVDLSLETMKALKDHNIKHSKTAIPCGHYTLGEKPWVYIDGYKIIRFLHKHLK